MVRDRLLVRDSDRASVRPALAPRSAGRRPVLPGARGAGATTLPVGLLAGMSRRRSAALMLAVRPPGAGDLTTIVVGPGRVSRVADTAQFAEPKDKDATDASVTAVESPGERPLMDAGRRGMASAGGHRAPVEVALQACRNVTAGTAAMAPVSAAPRAPAPAAAAVNETTRLGVGPLDRGLATANEVSGPFAKASDAPAMPRPVHGARVAVDRVVRRRAAMTDGLAIGRQAAVPLGETRERAMER
jgi:hypothetical protein